jgi:trans-aconitate methyltransferase
MQEADAIALLAPAGVDRDGPSAWADLGCGDGTFTRALASLLPDGSRIHAIDLDAASLRAVPRSYAGVPIDAHRGDFMRRPWPFDDPDGVLMANSLHYVADQLASAPAPPGHHRRDS